MRQLVTALAIALAAIVFALQNSGPVNVKFFFWEIAGTSLALVLIITLIIGLIAGILFQMNILLKKNSALAAQKKRIGELEMQLNKIQVNK
jgi:uncharacterized integral membrane protein